MSSWNWSRAAFCAAAKSSRAILAADSDDLKITEIVSGKHLEMLQY